MLRLTAVVPNRFQRCSCMDLKAQFAALILSAGIGCSTGESPSKLASAQAALACGNLVAAEQLASEIPVKDPTWAEGQLVLGAIAQQKGDSHRALKHYLAIGRDASRVSVAAALAAADLQQSGGTLHQAIQSYEYVLDQDPGDQQAVRQIAKLYAATNQRRLADVQLRTLMKSPNFTFKELVLLTDYDRRDPEVVRFLQQCEVNAPGDPAVNLGLAAEEIAHGSLKSARGRLESAVATAPDLAAAQGQLGEILLNEGEPALMRWYEQLPSSVLDSAEIWHVRGLWAQRGGHREAAARCFWEAARQIPTSYRAVNNFGIALTQVDPGVAEVFVERARQLFELRRHLSSALNSLGRDERALHQIIELLLDSGREWEAWRWLDVAQELYPHTTWVTQARARLARYPTTDAPRILDSLNPFVRRDLSYLPAFDPQVPHRSSIVAGPATELGTSKIQFVNEASQLGISFTYYQGRTSGTEGVRMQESTGGGVSVLDYDGDGLPDLYFTQGEDWPLGLDAPVPSDRYQDRLFRNLGAGFRDVTAHAQLAPEGGFGQGCSAGDFNNDGFADLYIANIGLNQLLINNGDGTFTDVTEQLPLKRLAWTTNCLIADLNGDGNPDLFDVNYLEGEEIFRRICDEQECTPQAFHSANDHVFLSNGDATVRSFEFGGEDRWGAGLGLVAFRHNEEFARQAASVYAARLSLFIANDHEPNFFLVNTPTRDPDNIALTDAAFLRGLAVNKDGRPTACMGVATGDLNGDGLLDLFVTNYKDEASNLYLQSPGGFFSDEIAGTGLLTPGLPYVKWGTQCLDADNDGRLDLVVANGHVGDFHKPGLECYMPTQFFRNRGHGQFVELSPEVVGPFFGEKLLGRTVATLDWNRDGLTDFVLSPIAAPVALLTNRTDHAGNFITVRVHAVSSARDALGSIVTVTTAAGSTIQQLTAGDGYQATNERVLRFGLGDQTQVLQVLIEWPNGAKQTIEDVPANTLLEVVEGRPQRMLTFDFSKRE